MIERVGVVGGGQMGAGITEVCARSGIDVVLVEIDEMAAASARKRLERSLTRAVERQKLEAADMEDILGRVAVGTDLDALAGVDLAIEAVIEDEEVKTGIFRSLDDLLGDDAILASNTSSIPIIRLARATKRPEAVLGVHFFNPAPVMPLVEIVTSLRTSDTVAEQVAEFVADVLDKTVVRSGDRAGFVVNALLIPFLVDAIRMYESGFASKEDIDAGMVNGANHPMGPLALCDLIGNDTVLAVAESLYAEFRDARFAPPPLLQRMVDAGLLGRKSGEGFYPY